MSYTKTQKEMKVFNVPKIFWNYTTKRILTLEKRLMVSQ